MYEFTLYENGTTNKLSVFGFEFRFSRHLSGIRRVRARYALGLHGDVLVDRQGNSYM